MSKATLTPIAREPGVRVFRINAPGVKAALTRKNGIATDKTIKRIFTALKVEERDIDLYRIEFRRRESGNWYARITLVE